MKINVSCTMIALWFILFFGIVRADQKTLYLCNSNSTCGCSTNPVSITKIVGGQPASTQTWGWAVFLYIDNAICTGSILSSTWIISAAHCLSEATASSVTVYAGSNNRSAPNQVRKASNIFVHPDYDPFTKVNDIALVQLITPLVMSDPNVNIICLPSVDDNTMSLNEWPPININVVAVGWGTLMENGTLASSYLQQVTLQTVSYDTSSCHSVIYNPLWQMCAGVSGGGKDTCQGDSGGPLMMFTASNQWELVGVTSYGAGCGRAQSSGIYTRVGMYQDWINATINGSYTNPIRSDPSATVINTSGIGCGLTTSVSSLLFSLSFIVFYILLLVE